MNTIEQQLDAQLESGMATMRERGFEHGLEEHRRNRRAIEAAQRNAQAARKYSGWALVIMVLLALAILSGCAIAPYNTNFPMMETGMTRDEVRLMIGPAHSSMSGPEDTKILFYRLAGSILDTDGSDTREYFVAMKAGEVIGYGERTDAITMFRAIQQHEAAWRASDVVTGRADVNVRVTN